MLAKIWSKVCKTPSVLNQVRNQESTVTALLDRHNQMFQISKQCKSLIHVLTMTLSESMIVLRRWAIVKTVQSLNLFLKVS